MNHTQPPPAAMPYRSHLQPFTPAELPKDAFSYQRYMDLYGMSKADAKRVVQRFKLERCFINDTYQVNVQPPSAEHDPFIHLSIKRLDKAPIHDWRDLQAIKNMIVGPEYEGVELFPKESRLVDSANQYHIWVLKREGQIFPLGFPARMVETGTGEINPVDNTRQAPLPQEHEQQQTAPAWVAPTQGQDDNDEEENAHG
jgi:hypothetical protein